MDGMRNGQEREKMTFRQLGERFLFHNLSAKILSLFGAALVWLLIVNIDDPYKTKAFVVSVNTINEEALRSVNKVYEVIEGSTASVSVSGKRSVIDELTAADISAVADLSELSVVNSVDIKVALKRNVSSDVTLRCSQVFKVSLEDMDTRQMKVIVDVEGATANGYLLKECVVKPNLIEMTGGESVVDSVSTVRVSMNVNGASENFSKMLEPVAYDERGKRVDSSTLSFSNGLVKVRARILKSKMIPISMDVTGKPAKGYALAGVSCQPDEIEIAGPDKILDSLTELVIPVDVTGLKELSSGLEREVSVSDYLPPEITVSQEYQSFSVKISVEQLMQKNIQVSMEQMELRNIEDGFVAGIAQEGYVEITVQARKSLLAELSDREFTGYVDCSGLETGRYFLPVQIKLDKEYQVMKRGKVGIVVTPAFPSQESGEPVGTLAPIEDMPEETPVQTPEATDTVEEDQGL